MLLSEDKKLFAIDFNRLDYGDPWEEFNRMPWNVMASSLFSTGLLHGYFGEEPSEDFFRLMALYIGANQLGGFAWAKAYGNKELQTQKNQTNQVMDWYDDFQEVVPSWYQSKDEVGELKNE